jgi:hypothetical protein
MIVDRILAVLFCVDLKHLYETEQNNDHLEGWNISGMITGL